MVMRNFILWLAGKRGVTDFLARRGMRYGFARRFVAGETLEEALGVTAELCGEGPTVSLNHLGENVGSEAAARVVCDGYIHMLEEIHARNLAANISIKLTQIGLDFGQEFCAGLAADIARRAKELGRTIEIDMEGSKYTDVTLDIFERVQREYGNVGLAIQAYLHRSAEDLRRLEPLRPKIRLVKGAYREPKEVAVQGKAAVDGAYRKLTTQLMEGAARGVFFPAIGSHDHVMAVYAQEEADRLGLARDKYEFQMLYGIRRDLQRQVLKDGNLVQVYLSFGTDWCPWFMRRLAEKPGNCWFVLRSLAERRSEEVKK
jgi:proline dehydrogenase